MFRGLDQVNVLKIGGFKKIKKGDKKKLKNPPAFIFRQPKFCQPKKRPPTIQKH